MSELINLIRLKGICDKNYYFVVIDRYCEDISIEELLKKENFEIIKPDRLIKIKSFIGTETYAIKGIGSFNIKLLKRLIAVMSNLEGKRYNLDKLLIYGKEDNPLILLSDNYCGAIAGIAIEPNQ